MLLMVLLSCSIFTGGASQSASKDSSEKVFPDAASSVSSEISPNVGNVKIRHVYMWTKGENEEANIAFAGHIFHYWHHGFYSGDYHTVIYKNKEPWHSKY